MSESKRSLETRLAELDLSDQSSIRERLQKDLLRRIARQETQRGRLAMFARPTPAFGMGILVCAFTLTLAHPDGRAALSKLPRLFHIGEHTTVVTAGQMSVAQMDSILAVVDMDREKGEMVVQNTPYGGWGGAVPEGREPYIKEACSLRLAADLVDYALLVPTYFDERIPAFLRFQKAVVLPAGEAMLYFGIGPLETVLLLNPVSDERTVSYSTSVTTMTEDGGLESTVVPPDLEDVQVADRTVVWQKHSEGTRRNLGGLAVTKTDTEIGRFLWEQDGLSCVLDGKFLTKDEGMKIIASLRTYRGNR